MSPRAFISHASENRLLANSIYDHLIQNGYSCWMAPQSIDPAQSWMKAILQGIKSSDVIVLLLCRHANISKFVHREIDRALHYDKKVLAVRLEALELSDELEFALSVNHWLEAESLSEPELPITIAHHLEPLCGKAGTSEPLAVEDNPPDELLEDMPIEEVFREGLELIAEDLTRLKSQESPCPSKIGRVIDLAIHYGAPIYNKGGRPECARLYYETALGINDVVSTEALNTDAPWWRTVKDFLGEIAEIRTEHPPERVEYSDDLAWRLRCLFDRFHVARGLETVAHLTQDIASHATPTWDEFFVVIVVSAIQHGNHVFQARDLEGCAVLHYFTARKICRLAIERAGDTLFDPTRRFVENLCETLDTFPTVEPNTSRELAWTLYEIMMRFLKDVRKD